MSGNPDASALGPDAMPWQLLIRDGDHLQVLLAQFRRDVETGRDSGPAARRLREAFRLRGLIEERICLPPLLGTLPAPARSVVERMRRLRSELQETLDRVAFRDGAAETPPLAAIERTLEACLSEEKRELFPLFEVLPGVTLREMSLEMEELWGRR